ncbi:MAG TPA: hypothetical protein VGR04_00085, partial [Acidimicrobiia bacterium]|nr:hypothetical protein [Acidimicrobiia bacterium]
MAGFFFAFSACVMKALARLPAAQGVAAMQSINVVVINPLVMAALFGTALACGVLAIASFVEWGRPVLGLPARRRPGLSRRRRRADGRVSRAP